MTPKKLTAQTVAGLIACFSCLNAFAAEKSEFTADWREQSINNDMGPARTIGVQVKLHGLGPMGTLLLRAEDKSWRMKGQDFSGQSFSAAAYYELSPVWTGVSQIQIGRSALFPKSTLVQGLLYKTGEQGQWVWGADLGQTRFNDGSRLSALKLGPTYYWAGANPGFVTYRYTKGDKVGNSGHTLDTQISLSYTLRLGLSHISSQGAYSVLVPGTDPIAANVKSRQTELRLIKDLNANWSVQLRGGETKVDDTQLSRNVLSSKDVMLAVTHRW